MGENPKSGNGLVLTLAVIAALAGLPTTLIIGLTQNLTILQAIGWVVVYILVVGTAGIITGVWQKIQPQIIDDIANPILDRMQKRGQSKFHRAYLQHLIYSHRTFDVKGLSVQGPFSLELEKVFVDLNISPEVSPGSSPVPQDLRQGGHSIWTWLSAPEISHMAILGAPGSGKTTLLKFITLSLANRNRKSANEIPDKLPIFLFLREHAKTIVDEPDTRLTRLILESLKLMQEQPPEGWFESRLKDGNCLIMLDGLDEVADVNARKIVVKWVENQIQAHGNNRFLITSRPYGYRSNPIGGVSQLEVRPFNRTQIELFVYNWYLANEIMSHQKFDPGVEMEAKKGADDLMRRIGDSRDIAELAVNPLLLTMIANVHRFRSSLPGRRVELYAQMCEVFLGKRQESKGIENTLTPAQKQSVLRHLAYATLQQQTREFTREEALAIIAAPLAQVPVEISGQTFLELIRDGSGILIERESGEYSFSHKTFQEYLTAVHIQEEKLQDELIQHIPDEWWHETIRLYCALGDATPVVTACLDQEPTPIDTLVLAIECGEEAMNLQPSVKQQLDDLITDNLEAPSVEARRIAAQIVLKRRLRRLARHDDNTYVDTTMITQAEFQLFLGNHPEYAPDHWKGNQFADGDGKEPIVGVTFSAAEAFCAWLNLGEAEAGWSYRLPRKGEIRDDGSYWISDDSIGRLAETQSKHGSFGAWVLPADRDITSHASDKLLHRQIELSAYQPEILLTLFARDLASDLALALARDLVLARALARALDLARARALARDLALAVNRALAPALTSTRAHDLARALASASAHARDLARALALDRASDLAPALASASALDLALARALASASALDRASAFDRAIALNNAGDQDQALLVEVASLTARYVELVLLLFGAANPVTFVAFLKEMFLLNNLRRSLLTSAQVLSDKEPLRVLGSHSKWEETMAAYVEAYAILAMLERRRSGEWEAVEGIMIVKARDETPLTAKARI